MTAVGPAPNVGRPASCCNPFCTRFVRPGAIAFRFANQDDENDVGDPASKILEQLVARRFGLIVGRHGSGKSTLVQTLLPMLADRFCEVRTIQTHAPVGDLRSRMAHRRRTAAAVTGEAKSLSRGGLMIVDGIEQLGFASRQLLVGRAARNAQSILATSHRHLSPFTSLFETHVSAELITNLTERLLADSPSDLASTIRRELQSRPLTTLEDVRELWFDLYDVVETWRSHLRINPKERA